MRLLRVGPAGHERPAVLEAGGTAYDLTPLTAEPVIFLKAPNTVVGPDDAVLVPRGSVKTDSIADDVSERAIQHELGGQWDMVFGVRHVVRHPSRFMVLEPGDGINTGTPAGVAFGENDFPCPRAGGVVEAEIDGLGPRRHVVGRA